MPTRPIPLSSTVDSATLTYEQQREAKQVYLDHLEAMTILELQSELTTSPIDPFAENASDRDKQLFTTLMRAIWMERQGQKQLSARRTINTMLGAAAGPVIRDRHNQILAAHSLVRQRFLELPVATVGKIVQSWWKLVIDSLPETHHRAARLALVAAGLPGFSQVDVVGISRLHGKRWELYKNVLQGLIAHAAFPEYGVIKDNAVTLTDEAMVKLSTDRDGLGRADATVTRWLEIENSPAPMIVHLRYNLGLPINTIHVLLARSYRELTIGLVRSYIHRFELALSLRNLLDELHSRLKGHYAAHPVDRSKFTLDAVTTHRCFDLVNYLHEEAALPQERAIAVVEGIHRILLIDRLQLACGCPGRDPNATCLTPPKRPVGRPRKPPAVIKFNEAGPVAEDPSVIDEETK